MAADGGGGGGGGGPPPSIKNEEEGLFGDSNKQILLHDDNDNDNNHNNNNRRGISIAERRAAKCGFNAANINSDRFGPTTPSTPQLRSPYFTVPPGLSPSVLLDSPVMLPNAQAQLSPTTGTFQFPSPNHERLNLKRKLATNGDETIAMDSSSRLHSHPALKPFDEFEYSRECFDDTLGKTQVLGHRSREADSDTINNNKMLISHNDHHTSGVQEIRSTHPYQEKNHKGGSCAPKEMVKNSEDGFSWRKYGQKHVKGSVFPRSYYKCTDTDCLVRKKVERSYDGQVTEIVYKGSHNHPQPQNSKRFSEITENMGQVCSGGSAGFKTANHHQGKDAPLYTSPDNGLDGLSFLNDFPDHQSGPISMFEPVENQDISARFCCQDGDDQNGDSPDSISFEDDDQNGECESKKRKRESVPNETAVPRSTREPKVVVQIESDIDILEDGYKWRKYGQKVVKGNPNPRSYYKCTASKCPVRKHVERAADDIKSVITTYEGKHNHQVPCSKTANTAANLDVASGNTSSAPSSSLSSSMAHKSIINDAPKPGKVQAQDLSLFMETKPILNYNEMMNSNNLPPPAGNFAGTSSSSVYPVSFPAFHSMHYSTLMMNSNYCMNSYPISKLYPTLSDYMAMPSQVNHIPAAGGGSPANNNMMPVASNFHYNNNYPTTQTPTRAHEQVRDCPTKNTVKPKEEPKLG